VASEKPLGRKEGGLRHGCADLRVRRKLGPPIREKMPGFAFERRFEAGRPAPMLAGNMFGRSHGDGEEMIWSVRRGEQSRCLALSPYLGVGTATMTLVCNRWPPRQNSGAANAQATRLCARRNEAAARRAQILAKPPEIKQHLSVMLEPLRTATGRRLIPRAGRPVEFGLNGSDSD